jgi:hypothetical protein
MRTLVPALFVATTGLLPPTVLSAQTVSDRVAQVRDGTLRLSFATRSMVCGNGEFIGFDLPEAFYTYASWRDGYSVNVLHDVKPDCRSGPLRLAIVKRSGRVTELRAAVGVSWRQSETAVDLGTVSAAEAADWLLGLAESADDDVARMAFLAAAAAEGTRIVGRVLGLAQNRRASASVRERAIRWAGVIGAAEGRIDEVDRALRAIAAEADEAVGVRERAIRELGATPENRAYLRSLYGRIGEPALRERILREVGSEGTEEDVAWLRNVASERGESLTLRERAIRVLGEELNRPQEVRALYARLAEPALRERALRVAVEQGGTAELAWVREVAEDPGEGGGVRDRAIRLLAERGEMAHLRALYPKLDRLDLRERVIRSVAERHDAEAAAWLADIVLDDRAQSALRDRAVRSLADAGTPSAELAALYDRVGSSAVKQRLIRVLADRRDDAAARKLAAIAAGDPDAALRREAERRRR